MNPSLALLICTLLLSPISYASDRGLFERLNGEGSLPTEQTIELARPIQNFEGQLSKKITLRALHGDHQEQRLKLDKNRSIVLIDQKATTRNNSINDLAPSLKKSVLNVVNGKSQVLAQRGIQYSKKGMENFYVFGNFRASRKIGDRAEWFIAIIPKSVQVEELFLDLAWLGSGAGANCQIRFTLNKPIVVIPQADETYVPQILENGYGKGDLVFHTQATSIEKGKEKWSPMVGLSGAFGSALMLEDTRTLALEQIKSSVVKEYRLNNLNATEKKKILLMALQLSNAKQEMGIYHSVFAGATNASMRVLKAGIPAIDTTWFNPYTILQKVGRAHGRGMDYNGSLNDQFGPILDGKGVMSQELLQKSKDYKFTSTRRHLLQSEIFEDFTQKVSLFLLDRGLSQDAERLLSDQNTHGKLLKDKKDQKVWKQLSQNWKKEFAKWSIQDLFKAIRAIDSQLVNN